MNDEQPRRAITQAEGAAIIGAWADRAIRPLCVPSTEDPDWSRDEECDAFLRAVADDPDADLSAAPRPLLLLAWTRVLWATAAAGLEPDTVMAHPPAGATDRQILQGLIGLMLARTRVPPPVQHAREGWPRGTHPGSTRRN